MTEHDAKIHNESGTWLVNEADKLIEEYKACKTAHARWLLLPKMNHLINRMKFESKEIEKAQDV